MHVDGAGEVRIEGVEASSELSLGDLAELALAHERTEFGVVELAVVVDVGEGRHLLAQSTQGGVARGHVDAGGGRVDGSEQQHRRRHGTSSGFIREAERIRAQSQHILRRERVARTGIPVHVARRLGERLAPHDRLPARRRRPHVQKVQVAHAHARRERKPMARARRHALDELSTARVEHLRVRPVWHP